MAATNLSYLYQLQGADYTSLANQPFRVAVVDPDDSGLTANQLHALQYSGRTVFSYLSIGEAEDYRHYWVNGNWDSNAPNYVLAENPDWPGNYAVKFWDPQWQTLMINQVRALAAQGYNGVYLDIVDGYQREEVIAAYGNGRGVGQSGDIRADMEHFVIALSQAAKAVNPDFKVIPQNAVELLALASNEALPNTAFLNAIDGVGKEDTFYDDNRVAGWSAGDVALLEHAIDAGKFVLAIDYPTQATKQADFIDKALDAGYIPYVGERDLDGTIPAINATIPAQLDSDAFDAMPSLVLHGEITADVMAGGSGHDALYGNEGYDSIYGAAGNDTIYGESGNDLITGDEGNDSITGGDGDDRQYGWTGDDTIYGSAGNDFAGGDDGNDMLFGEAGNDTIYGWTGDDAANGGTGTDWLFGDAGTDTLNGGESSDTLFGWTGNDIMNGDEGHDWLFGDDGDDLLNGNDGNDVLYGWSGNDTLIGGEGNNVLSGEMGDDSLVGGSRVDSIYGGDGADMLRGQEGQDYLDGGAGGDIVYGGAGADYMFGGADADIFYYAHRNQSTLSTTDFIEDFVHGQDHFQLAGLGYSAFAAVAGIDPTQLASRFDGVNTVLYDPHSDFAIILAGQVTLTNDDFYFA